MSSHVEREEAERERERGGWLRGRWAWAGQRVEGGSPGSSPTKQGRAGRQAGRQAARQAGNARAHHLAMVPAGQPLQRGSLSRSCKHGQQEICKECWFGATQRKETIFLNWLTQAMIVGSSL